MALGGFNDLPMGLMIDIGESSAGSINLIRDSLPKQQQHLVDSVKLQNTVEYAINVLDTQLGARTIDNKDLSTISNFISIGMTENGKDPYDSLENMISEVVKESFEYFSDKSFPKEYTKGKEKEVDELLMRYNFDFSLEHTWWEIVDFLFEKKEYVLAQSAQRYAVPTLVDLPRVAQQSNNLKEMYGDNSEFKLPTGENMIDFFSRGINEMITSYPILAHPTQYNLSPVRFLCIDLNDVAPEGDGKAAQQTNLMYMLARIVGTKNFFLDDKLLKLVPEQYQIYHKKRIKVSRETPKVLSYDEFHRTGGNKNIRLQVIRDKREGRKWNMQVNLVSQFLSDFDKSMVDIADSIFILSGGDISQEIADKFRLNSTMTRILESKITGATKDGAPMIVKHRTKKGDFQQFVYFTLSEMELWSNNSSAKDSGLRKQMSDLVGHKKSRQILATEFPDGSANALRELLEDKGETPKNKTINDVILEKVLDKHNILH
jgi:intracellular multiplication protein IcmB